MKEKMGILDLFFKRKTPQQQIQEALQKQLVDKAVLERLIREIDRQLINLRPRILHMERNVTNYTKGNLTKLKAERTDLEIRKMDLEREIRKIDEEITRLTLEERRLAA